MALETGTYISDLVSTNPTTADNISQGDDHLRLLKATIKATFPNISGAVNPTHTMVNTWFGSGNGTATPSASVITTPAGTGTNIAGANLTLLAGNGTGTGGSGYIAFQTAAAGTTGTTANTLTERMRIDSSGRVGIGVTPNTWQGAYGGVLQLSGVGTLASASQNLILSANFYDDGTTKYIANGSATYYQQNAGSHIWFNAAVGTAGAAVTFTERMRIDSTGNVGIGTAGPTYALDVVAPAGISTTAIRVLGNGTSSVDTRSIVASSGNGGSGRGVAISLQPSGSGGTVEAVKLIGYQETASATANNASFAIQVANTSGTLTERTRIDSSGYTYETNDATTKSTAVTLTAAEVLGGIIPSSPSGAITLTLPTGTNLDAAFPNVTGMCRDFAIVNTTGNTITLAANTGITLSGTMTVTSTSRYFRLRRTGSATYTCYLLS